MTTKKVPQASRHSVAPSNGRGDETLKSAAEATPFATSGDSPLDGPPQRTPLVAEAVTGESYDDDLLENEVTPPKD
ncbi:MAG: hypothetical protein JWN95_1261 [Frankiales bacterium]|nr:hypothetical protein [Frankiales bacterium]